LTSGPSPLPLTIFSDCGVYRVPARTFLLWERSTNFARFPFSVAFSSIPPFVFAVVTSGIAGLAELLLATLGTLFVEEGVSDVRPNNFLFFPACFFLFFPRRRCKLFRLLLRSPSGRAVIRPVPSPCRLVILLQTKTGLFVCFLPEVWGKVAPRSWPPIAPAWSTLLPREE